MARIDRFLIAPINSGMQTDLKPWIIPDDAFQTLDNAYVFRGRVVKRFGAQLMQGSTAPTPGFEQLQSRFRINVGTTDGNGDITTMAGDVPGIIFNVGQMFSIGNQIFTVVALGTPANMLISGTATSATYNTTTGVVTITGAAATTDLFFYPAQPVMGLINLEQQNVNDELIFGFDTQFSYQFTVNGWNRLGTVVWKGTNSDYFWGYNYRGTDAGIANLFVTNYNAGATLTDSDPMYYWDPVGSTWTAFQPIFNSAASTNTILTAKIIVPFQNRLILLNVVENTGMSPGTNKVYVNRCRYSQNGNPVTTDAFYENVAGKGGFIDLPIGEAIITAQFLKNRLIVYCESSTWELAYTGNQILPFVWQQINTELGAESTFSQVPFDKFVLGVGNVGIHACNGSNVERIDDKIPNAVFDIHNENNGVKRVYGIRDYYVEMVYWSFPDTSRTSESPFNNKVLVYNYKNGSWAFNDDSITAFGYYQASANEGDTWATRPGTWLTATETWNSGVAPLQAKFRSVIAGNQEGFTFIVNPDVARNSPALQITNMTKVGNLVTIVCINHNLQPGFADGDLGVAQGDYIQIENCIGITGLSADAIYYVNSVIDQNTFDIIEPNFAGAYLGGGTISRVSNIKIQTKQYNFYSDSGRNAMINKVDFLVDKTTNGEITVDYSIASSGMSQLVQGQLNGSLLGNGVLDTKPYDLVPFEQTQTRLWHPIYPMAEGECIQLNIYFTQRQIMTVNIAYSDFEMHAMIFYASATSSRLQ